MEALAARLARRQWLRIDPDHISESWRELSEELSVVYARIQQQAAVTALDAQGALLSEQSSYVAPEAMVDPRAFGSGYAASGVGLQQYFAGAATSTLTNIRQVSSAVVAIRSQTSALSTRAALGIADTARQAAGADTATRKGVGYTRVVSPGACSRCMILAGKFYRWNQGFLRHPHCYCRHVPSTQSLASDMITDPMEAFNSLSSAEQDRRFGKESAQAIRDGADISQVVNARSGVAPIGSPDRGGRAIPDFTTSGNGDRRGLNRSWYNLVSGTKPRLTPEGIYRRAGNRDEAIRMLSDYGYIIQDEERSVFSRLNPYRQTIGGYMGRGGRAKSHTSAFQEAVRTGVRNPNELATMTAAERRLADARLKYEHAMHGVDQMEMAEAERWYRHMLSTSGEIYTR